MATARFEVEEEGALGHILEHITARRSIRKLTNEPVNAEQVQQLLEAAMAAPSATNRQPWEFVVVTDLERLAALRRATPFGRFEAPLALVVCGNLRRALPGFARGFWIQDCSAAAQNVLLAATGLGLGGVWIGVHPIGLLERAVRSVLELPRHVVPLGVLLIGHPAETKAPRTQFSVERVHHNRFGQPYRLPDEEEGA